MAGGAHLGLIRPVLVALTIVALGFIVWEWTIIAPNIQPATWGVDFHQYLVHTQRWLDGGSLYLDRQLGGPYAIMAGDSLYPPTILYLTVPIVWGVPEPVWWVVPLGIIVAAVWAHRPAVWAWPIMVLLLATPRSIEIVLYGNPVMWATAALAAGTVRGWPSVGVLLKPSLFPLALWGCNRRSWWIALGVAILLAIPFGAMWLEWLQVVRDSRSNLAYSLPDLLFVVLPLVAWASGVRRTSLPGRTASAPGAPSAQPPAPRPASGGSSPAD